MFGGIGVTMYLGWLSSEIFRHSILFPFALSAIGLLIMYVGYQYQTHYVAIQATLYSILPGFIVNSLPRAHIILGS